MVATKRNETKHREEKNRLCHNKDCERIDCSSFLNIKSNCLRRNKWVWAHRLRWCTHKMNEWIWRKSLFKWLSSNGRASKRYVDIAASSLNDLFKYLLNYVQHIYDIVDSRHCCHEMPTLFLSLSFSLFQLTFFPFVHIVRRQLLSFVCHADNCRIPFKLSFNLKRLNSAAIPNTFEHFFWELEFFL